MLRTLPLEKYSFHSLRRIIRPAAIAAAMFLLMHAELLMRASPLAAALMAAALAAGENPGPLVAGCILGMLRRPLADAPLLPAISCAVVLALELAAALPVLRRRCGRETRASLAAGLGVLLPAMVHAGGAPLDSARALACGALAASAAPFLCAMLMQKDSHDSAAKTGAALLAGGCIAALWSMFAPAAEGLCCLLVLLFPTPGAGALTGIALAAGGAGLMKTACLCLCALACTNTLFPRKWQRALAACTAAVITRMMADARALDPRWMICAAAVYVLLPDFLPEKLLPRRAAACSADAIIREATRETRRRLTALSDAFSAMAEGCVAAVDVPDEQELICEMRSRLCAGCPAYGDCWAGRDNRAVHLLCDLIGEALERVDAPPGMRILYSDGEIPPDILRICRRGRMIPERLGLLLRDFAERRRSEIKRCANGQLMSIQFLQAKEILLSLARTEGTAGMQQLNAALTHAGLDECTAVPSRSDGSCITLMRSGKRWTRSEVKRASRTLGRVLGGRYRALPDGENLCFIRSPRFRAEAGASCQSGLAGEICGDSHLVRELGGDKLMLAISDGMGSGETAARESAEALRLLWRFLDAGISRSLALETVNRQLLAGSGEDMFATIDLCIIDLNTGIAEFTKLAASATLILRGRELMHVDGGRLPLGILENVQPGVRRLRLHPGDVLVMGSDGVMEAGDGLDIERCARENAAAAPQQLSEKLVRRAALQRDSSRRDDLTCICVRIGDAKKA